MRHFDTLKLRTFNRQKFRKRKRCPREFAVLSLLSHDLYTF